MFEMLILERPFNIHINIRISLVKIRIDIHTNTCMFVRTSVCFITSLFYICIYPYIKLYTFYIHVYVYICIYLKTTPPMFFMFNYRLEGMSSIHVFYTWMKSSYQGNILFMTTEKMRRQIVMLLFLINGFLMNLFKHLFMTWVASFRE